MFKYLLHAPVWNNFVIILLLLCLVNLRTQMELSTVLLTCMFLSKHMSSQAHLNYTHRHYLVPVLTEDPEPLPGPVPNSCRVRQSRGIGPSPKGEVTARRGPYFFEGEAMVWESNTQQGMIFCFFRPTFPQQDSCPPGTHLSISLVKNANKYYK